MNELRNFNINYAEIDSERNRFLCILDDKYSLDDKYERILYFSLNIPNMAIISRQYRWDSDSGWSDPSKNQATIWTYFSTSKI